MVSEMVRIGLALLMLQLSAFSEEKAGVPPIRVVADPVGAYYREKLVNEGMAKDIGNLPTFLQTVEADFNCDGKVDLAVTDCFEVRAKAGTWWSIFLHRPDGKYAEVGSVGTKSARFKITPSPKGGGDLAVMLRGGPGDLVIEFYRVTQRGLKKVRDEEVVIREEHVGPTRIDEVFGDGFSEKPTKQIPLAELKKKYP